MQVQFQCNLADYQEALHARLKKTIGYYVLLVLGGLNVLVGTFLAYKVDFREGLILQLVGVFWLAWPVVLRPLWVRRDFRKHPNFSVAQVVEVSDEGLHSKSDIAEGTAKWSAFTSFQETRNLFMLQMGARMFRVIPKRALSGVQSDEFRELLRRKLSGK
ncbi:MAG: YcxB family protein [Terriglobales bacterium]